MIYVLHHDVVQNRPVLKVNLGNPPLFSLSRPCNACQTWLTEIPNETGVLTSMCVFCHTDAQNPHLMLFSLGPDEDFRTFTFGSRLVRRGRQPYGSYPLKFGDTPKSFGEGETKVNIKTTLKTSVAAAALFAVAAPAAAGTVSNSNDTASVTLSGHFNYGVLWMSDGDASKVAVVGNNNSRTRGRIVVKGKLNEAVSYTALSEWGMQSNSSSSVSPSDPNTAASPEVGSDNQFDQRHTMIRMSHKSFGSVRLGQTSEATDGITENNMTGASDIVYGGNTVVGNGIHLRRDNAAAGTPATSTTVGSMIASAGEGGRIDTIRYDTPSFGGFNAAASYQSDSSTAYALNYGGKFGGIKVDAGYGFKIGGGDESGFENSHGGSIALGHDSGLSVRASGGVATREATNRDHAWTLSFGGGYKANLVAAGSTNFAVDWTRNQNGTTDADSMDLVSIGVEQETDAGVKFYLGYQLFMAEQGAVEYDNASTVMAGTKVFF